VVYTAVMVVVYTAVMVVVYTAVMVVVYTAVRLVFKVLEGGGLNLSPTVCPHLDSVITVSSHPTHPSLTVQSPQKHPSPQYQTVQPPLL